MKNKLLDRAEFRAWLVANRRRVVGKLRDCDDCPLKRFLEQVKRVEDLTVGRWTMQIGTEKLPMDKWAVNFTLALDSSGASYSTVRGASALRILDAIGE